MSKIDVKTKLYYSDSIDIKPYINELESLGIEYINISQINPDMFKPKIISLFLLNEDFFSTGDSKNILENNSNTECVIFLFNKEEECNLLDDSFIIQYINASSPKKVILKAIKNGIKTLIRQRKVFELEKAVFIAEDEINELHAIGLALSTVKEIDKLLTIILKRCIYVTSSDAGSLYLVEKHSDGNSRLRFMLSDNYSLQIESITFTLPLDKTSIAGYVAVTKKILNIADSYNLPKNVEFEHSKKFDEKYNYKTKSILTFPLINHKDEVIGVIQLVNKRINRAAILDNPSDSDKYVIPYTERDEKYVQSLGAQAAIVLENALLYDDIQKLFEGFIKASVKAIESRDPTTSGHSERVAIYTVELAKAVTRTGNGKFENIVFSPQQIKEIRYASLLHDFGKVGVRENVLVKEKKLYPFQTDLIEARINYIKKDLISKFQAKKLEYLIKNNDKDHPDLFNEIDNQMNLELVRLDNYINEILRINEPKILSDLDTGLLDEIKNYRYIDVDGTDRFLLSDDEVRKLKIPKGSLDEVERVEIESHVEHTYKFLSNIPWTKELSNVPYIAYGHHEKLNGAGYPRKLKENEIPIQSKMMAIADIYDALTASDRPYKRAVPPEKALDILNLEVKDNHIDMDLLDIFISRKIYLKANNDIKK